MPQLSPKIFSPEQQSFEEWLQGNELRMFVHADDSPGIPATPDKEETGRIAIKFPRVIFFPSIPECTCTAFKAMSG